MEEASPADGLVFSRNRSLVIVELRFYSQLPVRKHACGGFPV